MAFWVLECSNCHKQFFHSKIDDGIINFFFHRRPKLPEGGQSIRCKNCGHTAVYRQSDLIYHR
jgi:DNA-directed RNA polymerase subunit RPC12/RpoP